jgi:hypothetical protein
VADEVYKARPRVPDEDVLRREAVRHTGLPAQDVYRLSLLALWHLVTRPDLSDALLAAASPGSRPSRPAARAARRELLSLVTAEEALLLFRAPYERPRQAAAWGREAEVVDSLVRRGFAERDPTAPRMYRCTAQGEVVREAFKKEVGPPGAQGSATEREPRR